MNRLYRWIPVLVLTGALCFTAGCGEENSADDESSEEGSDTASEGEDDEADEAKTEDPPAEEEGKKAEVAKPEPMGPEAKAAIKVRCGAAFDNTVAIMQTAGAPPQIVTQMRAQRAKTVGTCLEQAKTDPAGTRMLDCMLAARLPADIQTCTRKFGDIKPLDRGVPADDGHGH